MVQYRKHAVVRYICGNIVERVWASPQLRQDKTRQVLLGLFHLAFMDCQSRVAGIEGKIKMAAKRGKRIVLGLLVALAVTFVSFPITAAAHPLGNFTVNRYSRLDIGAAGVKIFYVLDMAEIPTFQEKDAIDLNRDDKIDDSEKASYAVRKATEIKSGLKLSVNNTPLELKLLGQDLTFPPGQGGLSLTRLTVQLETGKLDQSLGSNAVTNLSYRDDNYSDRLGWKEIVVKNASGVALQNSSAPSQDQSNELRTYPQDMLASPLAVTSAQVRFQLDPSVKVDAPAPGLAANQTATPKTNDPFADFINNDEITLPVLLLSLVGAFFLGVVHALSPGHGKTIVAAYLVGSRGTARQAALLGLVVTITHTLGVFALGIITLLASQFIVPEKLYPWLGLISGLIVVSMGVSLFRSRLRFAMAVNNGSKNLSSSGSASNQVSVGHDHNNNHDHNHDHLHDHDHEHPHTHDHSPTMVNSSASLRQPQPGASTDSRLLQPEQALIPVPAMTTITPDHAQATGRNGLSPVKIDQSSITNGSLQPHDSHDHSHSDDAHTHSHADGHSHSHEEGHSHDQGSHSHSHNGKTHSHLPPGMDGTAISGKKLILFGMSAGILPCPSALVVMLSAIALNKVAFGIVLIIIFSFGLAAAITAIGILMVYARHFLSNLKVKPSARVIKLIPVVSAFFVAIVGVAISYEALLQTGLFNR